MKPIVLIYWLRTALGIVAGALSAGLARFLESTSTTIEGTSILLYSVSLTLLIYLISYRILKIKFQNQVEKPSKITMTGIGMYFFAWIAFFVLFYTIIRVATGGAI
jgi:hypothetical protein